MPETSGNPSTIGDKDVHAFLDHFLKAYDGGDEKFFQYFTPNASIVTLSSAQRLDGREAFRKSFGPHLKAKRHTKIDSPTVESFGNAAAVTYDAHIEVEGHTHQARCSLILQRGTDGQLSVAQLHMSSPPLRSGEDIRILEERVATALSAVGTPK